MHLKKNVNTLKKKRKPWINNSQTPRLSSKSDRITNQVVRICAYILEAKNFIFPDVLSTFVHFEYRLSQIYGKYNILQPNPLVRSN